MTEDEAREQLQQEGFKNISIFNDMPNKFYPDHAHMAYTAHIVLDGEITLEWNGTKKTYKKEERFDIDKSDIHSATMGPEGCRYMVGNK
jgi:hypothetical protein